MGHAASLHQAGRWFCMCYIYMQYTASGVANLQQAGLDSHEQSQMQPLFSMTWACEPVAMHKVMLKGGCIRDCSWLTTLKPIWIHFHCCTFHRLYTA